jgi:NADH-quinone oxidoreductase subunit E
MESTFDYSALDKIIKSIGCQEKNIISILQAVQEKYRYLPKEAFPYMAECLNVSEARLYSVATFYENFSLEPKGKYILKICDGTACHVRKSVPILNEVLKELGLNDKKRTTDDMLFTVETVSCLGACGLAPVMTINDRVYPAMTKEKATELIKKLKEDGDVK